MYKSILFLFFVFLMLTACQSTHVEQPIHSAVITSNIIQTTSAPRFSPVCAPPICQPTKIAQATQSFISTPDIIKTTFTPGFRPICANPSPADEFASSDSFGDGYIARVAIQDVINKDQKDIINILVKQWLEHYKTQSKSASAAIKKYSINNIKLNDPYCDPYFLIYASVDFSITPVKILNEYSAFPSISTNPNDVWGHLIAPFGVFIDGNYYRLRLVPGWGT